MLHAVAVFVGGGIGALLRYAVSHHVGSRFGDGFPLGTLLVNVAGCFLIGFLSEWGGTRGHPLGAPVARHFLGVGILGGFTTFSTFSLQTLELARGGNPGIAALNCALHFSLCLGGAWAGFVAAGCLGAGR